MKVLVDFAKVTDFLDVSILTHVKSQTDEKLLLVSKINLFINKTYTKRLLMYTAHPGMMLTLTA